MSATKASSCGLSHGLKLDIPLALSKSQDAPESQSESVSVAISPEKPQERVLRRAITSILAETVGSEDDFALLREICQETLARKDRVRNLLREIGRSSSDGSNPCVKELVDGGEDGIQVSKKVLVPPKSPQERFKALKANAMEKGRSRYQRRRSRESVVVNEVPRWKTFDTEQLPITDLTVMFRGDAIPAGFTKLERSPTGLRADLNKGGRGTFVYLCQSSDTGSGKAPISEIIIIFPERGEFVPSDYEVVQRRGIPANLNTGTQGERIYLCIKRSATSAIVDVVVLFPKKGETLPYGYHWVDKTPNDHVADVNTSSGGTEIFLGYKKKLSCIDGLHKKWLQATVMPQLENESRSPRKTKSPKKSPSGARSPKEDRTPRHKTGEIREQETLDAGVVPVAMEPYANPQHAKQLNDLETLEYYMYPLLMACYTRHGAAAEAAVRGVADCLEAGLFNSLATGSDLCRLEVAVDAVTSVCQQAVRSRFPCTVPIYQKVIQICAEGFQPAVLHSVLKALTFIGEFNTAVAKPVEDELISMIMNRYEATQDTEETDGVPANLPEPAQSSQELVQELVDNLIEGITTGAEIATAADNMLGAFKSHLSIQSPQFCSDVTLAMESFTNSTAEKNALQLVVTFSRAVNRKLTRVSDTSLVESDHYPSVNSLHALNSALLAAGARTRENRVFGQVVRRFVLSTVNSVSLVWLPDVFQANLTLISTLWNHYRRHLKVELALLFEHLLLRILRTTAPCAQNHQMDIMHEITPWLQLPHNVVEIFLNFDMDRVQQWKIFEHLCSTLCSMGEGNISHSANPEDGDDSCLRLQIQAISTILAIARSVMDASGHAHLISRDVRTRMLSMDNGGWEQDESGEEASPTKESVVHVASAVSSNLISTRPSEPSSPVDTKDQSSSISKPRPSGSKYGSISVRMRNELQKRNQQLLKRAMEISAAKSLKKAVEYLVAMNFIKNTPRSVTSFLRIYHDFFDEVEIGDYLGEGDEDFKVQVRLTYVRAISFKGLTLVESLRHFLTSGGFRLPGEAQKIERMVEAFAQCFWDDSPTTFSSADTAMIVAYSIIMLNTDLHNPQVRKNKMSKEQFVKNNRGIDNGKDLPRRFLEEVYDDIARRPMQIKGSHVTAKASREASLSAADLDNEKFQVGLAKAVAQSEELMKDLSHTYNTFQFVGVDTSISPDLIKILFERVWFYLLALSTSTLCDDAQSDLSMQMHCLDLLRFCISTCLFLNMPVERQAFCALLHKVQISLDEARATDAGQSQTPSEKAADTNETTYVVESKDHAWVQNIEEAAASDDPWQVMGDIHLLVSDLKETIQRLQRSEQLDSVLRRIHRGHYYLKDTTAFLHEGELTKRCRSRNQVYRFFLFNDQLMYADRGMTGSWNPHNSLRLKLTRISDVPDSVLSRHAFQIQNPVKSFVVYAESASAKAEWLRLLDDAIAETSKKINRNAQRVSRSQSEPTEQRSPTSNNSVVSASPTKAMQKTPLEVEDLNEGLRIDAVEQQIVIEAEEVQSASANTSSHAPEVETSNDISADSLPKELSETLQRDDKADGEGVEPLDLLQTDSATESLQVSTTTTPSTSLVIEASGKDDETNPELLELEPSDDDEAEGIKSVDTVPPSDEDAAARCLDVDSAISTPTTALDASTKETSPQLPVALDDLE